MTAETVLLAGFNEALNEAKRWRKQAQGYREALQELADAIPMDRSAGDSPLMQAWAQAQTVLREGPG